MKTLTNLLARFGTDRSGATAIEYGLIIALIFLAILSAVTLLSGNLGASMTSTSDAISAAHTSSTGSSSSSTSSSTSGG